MNFEAIKKDLDELRLVYRDWIQDVSRRDPRFFINGDFFLDHYQSQVLSDKKEYIIDDLNVFLSKESDASESTYNILRRHIGLIIPYVTQYLYFGVVPDLRTKQSPSGSIYRSLGYKKHLEEGFYIDYFIWRKPGDIAVGKAPETLGITKNNFYNYRLTSLPFEGWSKTQLVTFLTVNLYPEFSKEISISKSLFEKLLNKYIKTHLYVLIKFYMNDKEKFLSQSVIDKLKACKSNTRILQDVIADYMREEVILERFISHLSNTVCFFRERIKYLKKKLKDSVIHKDHVSKRFKWQSVCDPSNLDKTLSLEDLRDIAILERIPHYLFLTKRELCAELSKRFQNVLEGKAKVEGKCINTTSIMMTDLKDIPPEFFYTYTHNNKIFCDDIRDLKKHFDKLGSVHPWDRSPVPQKLVSEINTWYNHLTKVTNTMEDLWEEYPKISTSSLLSSKTAELLNKLNYPNSGSYFTDADLSKVSLFVNALVDENILSPQERRQLSVFSDLTQYKLALIEKLLLKISNDPQRITIEGLREPLSGIAINISNVYNEIFTSPASPSSL